MLYLVILILLNLNTLCNNNLRNNWGTCSKLEFCKVNKDMLKGRPGDLIILNNFYSILKVIHHFKDPTQSHVGV